MCCSAACRTWDGAQCSAPGHAKLPARARRPPPTARDAAGECRSTCATDPPPRPNPNAPCSRASTLAAHGKLSHWRVMTCVSPWTPCRPGVAAHVHRQRGVGGVRPGAGQRAGGPCGARPIPLRVPGGTPPSTRAKLLCRVVSCTPKTRAVQQLEQLCSWHANVGCIACAAVFLRRQGVLCQNATDVQCT